MLVMLLLRVPPLSLVQYQHELHMEKQKMRLLEDDLENAEDRLSQAQKRAEKAETELEEKIRLATCVLVKKPLQVLPVGLVQPRVSIFHY